MSFKEISMLLLGILLIYALFYLKTHDQIFAAPQIAVTEIETSPSDVITQLEPEPKVLSPAVLDQVEIPEWLTNNEEYELSNLTAEDLLELAQLAHQQDHDFFPENQNTLAYLMKAKELGIETPEVEELLTTVHAALYTEAEQAIRDYDAQTLTALTARLKSIDSKDTNIATYTNQISIINTLKRMTTEAADYLASDVLYLNNQNDAVHTILSALEVDQNYQPLLELKNQTLNNLQNKALRATQEMDFTIAEENISIMTELDASNPMTLQTIDELNNQKQTRFTYLDQQFYTAINNLNLDRAENLIQALAALELPSLELDGYWDLLKQTQTYGSYQVSQEFNDLLQTGARGPTMTVIPAGDFYMGSANGTKHQRPRHRVEINYGFAVSKNEITVGEFGEFVQATGYQSTAEQENRTKIYDERSGRFKYKYKINWRHDYLGKPADKDLPVIHVSWNDAMAYANWLASNTGENYRLPSESEFEYILAGGRSDKYPWGNDEPTQIWGNFSGAKDKFKKSRIRWREGFSEYTDGHWGPAAVGSFITNLFGLNDLSGNVMEWVDDCWHDSYVRAPGNGASWVNPGCQSRVIRGGNWASANQEYQTHHRLKAEADYTDPRLGFRVARTLLID